MYTVDYFIDKFSAIPSKKWTVGKFTEVKKSFFGLGKPYITHCALGHCDSSSKGYDLNGEANALSQLFIDHLGVCVAVVNDSSLYQYKQSSPKKRILAALQDIKAIISQKEEDNAVKEAQAIIDLPIPAGVV